MRLFLAYVYIGVVCANWGGLTLTPNTNDPTIISDSQGTPLFYRCKPLASDIHKYYWFTKSHEQVFEHVTGLKYNSYEYTSGNNWNNAIDYSKDTITKRQYKITLKTNPAGAYDMITGVDKLDDKKETYAANAYEREAAKKNPFHEMNIDTQFGIRKPHDYRHYPNEPQIVFDNPYRSTIKSVNSKKPCKGCPNDLSKSQTRLKGLNIKPDLSSGSKSMDVQWKQKKALGFDPKHKTKGIHPMMPKHCMMTSSWMIAMNAGANIDKWTADEWNEEVKKLDKKRGKKPGDTGAYRFQKTAKIGKSKGAFSDHYVARKLEEAGLYFQRSQYAKNDYKNDWTYYYRMSWGSTSSYNIAKTYQYVRSNIIGQFEGVYDKSKWTLHPIVGVLLGVSTKKDGGFNHGVAVFRDANKVFWYIDTNEKDVVDSPYVTDGSDWPDKTIDYPKNTKPKKRLQQKEENLWFPMTKEYKLNIITKQWSLSKYGDYHVQKSMRLGDDLDVVAHWLQYKMYHLPVTRGGINHHYIIRRGKPVWSKQDDDYRSVTGFPKAMVMDADYYYYDDVDTDYYDDEQVQQKINLVEMSDNMYSTQYYSSEMYLIIILFGLLMCGCFICSVVSGFLGGMLWVTKSSERKRIYHII